MAEKVIFETKPSLRRAHLSSLVYALLTVGIRYLASSSAIASWLLLGVLGVILIHMLYETVRVACTSYRITDQYVELEEGIVARKSKRVPWLKITNFTREQSVSGRMLGLVNVLIDTPGHDQWELEFFELAMADADRIMELLQEYVPDAKGPVGEAAAEGNVEK